MVGGIIKTWHFLHPNGLLGKSIQATHVSPNALQVGGSHAQCLFLLCLLLNETHGGDHPRLRTLAGRH